MSNNERRDRYICAALGNSRIDPNYAVAHADAAIAEADKGREVADPQDQEKAAHQAQLEDILYDPSTSYGPIPKPGRTAKKRAEPEQDQGGEVEEDHRWCLSCKERVGVGEVDCQKRHKACFSIAVAKEPAGGLSKLGETTREEERQATLDTLHRELEQTEELACKYKAEARRLQAENEGLREIKDTVGVMGADETEGDDD